MKWLERLILPAGLAMVAYLLWRFDARAVWAMVSQVGLVGFISILSFQIFDHALNAWGWRFGFGPQDAPKAQLWTLIKVRIAGDGVNYLTPSGQIAGELIRPGMLGPELSDAAKNGSVLVAKFSQALGQALFILLGMTFVLHGKLNILGERQWAIGLGGAVFVVAGVSAALWILAADNAPRLLRFVPALEALRGRLRGYLTEHPWRFAASIFFFMGGYTWGAFEVLVICHFMGIPMPFMTALAVEILSNVVDALMFMVPGKVGTQEAGKTAIFHGLGYAASQGLAFGLIRHTRELCWAALGFTFYALNRKRSAKAAALPSSPAPL